eukprot:58073-Chlamydomonas_euryale.AAC.3
MTNGDGKRWGAGEGGMRCPRRPHLSVLPCGVRGAPRTGVRRDSGGQKGWPSPSAGQEGHCAW